MPCEKMDLQVCTSRNFKHQEINYKFQEEFVKEEENGVHNFPSILYHRMHYSTLQARCLTNCSWEADEGQLENALTTTKENAGSCQKRLAKKAAECRKGAEKRLLSIMLGSCEG